MVPNTETLTGAGRKKMLHSRGLLGTEGNALGCRQPSRQWETIAVRAHFLSPGGGGGGRLSLHSRRHRIFI